VLGYQLLIVCVCVCLCVCVGVCVCVCVCVCPKLFVSKWDPSKQSIVEKYRVEGSGASAAGGGDAAPSVGKRCVLCVVCVCVCVYIHMYMCVYTHTHKHTHMYTHTQAGRS
jgi:hypothetical protein